MVEAHLMIDYHNVLRLVTARYNSITGVDVEVKYNFLKNANESFVSSLNI